MSRYTFLNRLIDVWEELRYLTNGLALEDGPPTPREPTQPLATVEQARARLRLDADFPESDIELALTGASEAVMAYLKRPTNYSDDDPAPPQVVNAVLMLTGIFIRDPDGVEANDKWEQGYLPHAVTALLYPLRDPALE
jgi:Phage gp6-like head-tail connector protein